MSALRLFDKFQKLLDVTWPSIADGQTLKRSGSNIIGYTPGGGSGDVVGPASSVASEVALFSGTTGKVISRATGTGFVSVVNGVYQTPTSVSSVVKLPISYLGGMTLSNNATDAVNDIDVAVGECRDSTNVGDIALASALTKRLDAAWVAGTNQGGRDTGAIADGTWHVFAIKHPSTLVCDVLLSLSATAPTMPSGYTLKRRIGSVIRRTATIVAFKQISPNYFRIAVPIQDFTDAEMFTPATSVLALLQNAPVGIKTQVSLNCGGYSPNGGFNAGIYDPDQGNPSIGALYGNAASQYALTFAVVWTNTAAQIAFYHIAGANNVRITGSMLGWTDPLV